MVNQSENRKFLAEMEIEALRHDIEVLAEENQCLDWTIPSQYQQILDNADQIDFYTLLISAIEVHFLRPSNFDAYANLDVGTHFTLSAPPGWKLPAQVISTVGTNANNVTPIRKKHLTLIHSSKAAQ